MSSERPTGIPNPEINRREQPILFTPQTHPEIRIALFSYMQRRINNRIKRHEIAYPVDDVVKLSEAEGIGPKIKVNRRFLYGTQLARENNRRGSTERVIEEFERDPDYLYNNPALVCMEILANGSSKLIVVDGHHRIRNASRVLNIDESGKTKPHYPLIPVRVFTFSQYVELLNKSNPDQLLRIGEELYREDSFKNEAILRASMVEKEMESFTIPAAMPIPINGVSSIEQLVEAFGK